MMIVSPPAETLLLLVCILAVAKATATSNSSNITISNSSNLTIPIQRNVTCLYQEDFQKGTFIIDEPGRYQLCEDISFSPNDENRWGIFYDDTYDPIFPGDYDENAFALGYFAAIAITASDVDLYLNSHTIQQSAGHALFQRFFAVIELASSPFIKDTGPSQFVGNASAFQAATNVRIFGPGTIGRSSHHGIHGNQNSNILISNVEFKDFEVAAVSLNKVDSLTIEDCIIPNNRQDVPVVGLFSAARFLRPYGKKLAQWNFKMELRGQMTSSRDVYIKLLTAMVNVYRDVTETGRIDSERHSMEYELFDNPFRTVDGPCYAFVVHGKGPAVGGFGDILNETDYTATSSDIVIRNNTINNIRCWTKEIPAAVEDGIVVNDIRGAVFQFVDSLNTSGIAINPDGSYKGNVVADMQIMVANAAQEGFFDGDSALLQTGVNTIPSKIIEWARNGSEIYSPAYRCNGDAMHHVSKGIVVIRVEDTLGFSIEGNTINDITNLSPPNFDNCTDYHAGASQENLAEQQSSNIRAISVAAVRGYSMFSHSEIKDNKVSDMASSNANCIIGVDVQGDSKAVDITGNKIVLFDPNRRSDVCSIRIRMHVNTTGLNAVRIGDGNKVIPDPVFEHVRRNLRISDTIPPLHPNIEGGIEWNIGGCPFGNSKKAQNKN